MKLAIVTVAILVGTAAHADAVKDIADVLDQALWTAGPSTESRFAFRVIYWLHQRKTTTKGVEVARTSMPAVRRALKELRELNLSLWDRDRPSVLVDASGHLLVNHRAGVHDLSGPVVSEDLLDLIAPFSTGEGTRGPDLIAPRVDLRIVPGKLSGSPHVVHTRLETRALAALATDGFDVPGIHRLYPYVTALQIEQALELEDNLIKRAASRS
jgi:uncharacterized protein (DUF433 family)